jgi:hypothetical protein
MRSVEMYVKGGDVFGADEAMKKAVSQANTRESAEIYSNTMKMMKAQAQLYEQTNKRANAVQMYEKILQMRVTNSERDEIKTKLQELYEKLGKIKELRHLQGTTVTSSRPEVKAPSRPPVPGAIRDPKDTGAFRQRPFGQRRPETVKPTRNEDLDIDQF